MIGDGTEGNTAPWGGAWNCTADPANPTGQMHSKSDSRQKIFSEVLTRAKLCLAVLPVNYAAKSFLDPRGAKSRRVNWSWINVNNVPGVEELTPSAGMLGVPTELTFEPTLRRLVYNPLPELTALRTHRIGGFDGAALPANTPSERAKDTAAGLWMGAPPEVALEQADYVATFPVPPLGRSCQEMGLLFALDGTVPRRNVSISFLLCPPPQQAAAAAPGLRPGLFEARVDMRNGSTCNKMCLPTLFSQGLSVTFPTNGRPYLQAHEVSLPVPHVCTLRAASLGHGPRHSRAHRSHQPPSLLRRWAGPAHSAVARRCVRRRADRRRGSVRRGRGRIAGIAGGVRDGIDLGERR